MTDDLIVIDGEVREIEERKPDLFEKGLISARLGLKLSEKQNTTAERYLIHFDLVRAVREGYGYEGQVVYNTVSSLKDNPNFVGYIAARLEEKSLAADQVLAQIADIATSSVEDFLNDEMLDLTGTPMWDLRKAKELGKLHLVKRIRYLKEGGYEIEMWDRQWALELLAKHLMLLKQEEVKIDNYVINVVRDDGHRD